MSVEETIRLDDHPSVGGIPVWNEECTGCGAFVGANLSTRDGAAAVAGFRCCCGRSWSSRRVVEEWA